VARSPSSSGLGDADYFNPRCYWFLDNEGLALLIIYTCNNASLFRRAAFEGSAAIPSESFRLTLRSGCGWHVVDHPEDKELTRNEWFYIFGGEVARCTCRGSGRTATGSWQPSVVEGRFHLSLHWRRDYVPETRRILK